MPPTNFQKKIISARALIRVNTIFNPRKTIQSLEIYIKSSWAERGPVFSQNVTRALKPYDSKYKMASENKKK